MTPPRIEAIVGPARDEEGNEYGTKSLRMFPIDEPNEAASWIAAELKRQTEELGLT